MTSLLIIYFQNIYQTNNFKEVNSITKQFIVNSKSAFSIINVCNVVLERGHFKQKIKINKKTAYLEFQHLIPSQGYKKVFL